jgi:ATP-dependent DNA ligase
MKIHEEENASPQVRLNDATARFAPITELLAKLPARSAVLDGEIAVPDKHGVTRLDLLDKALLGRGGPLVCYAFDLLHCDGWDLRRCPLLDRKARFARWLLLARHRIGSDELPLTQEFLKVEGAAVEHPRGLITTELVINA